MKKSIFIFLMTFLSVVASAQRLDGTWSGKLDITVLKLSIVVNINGDSCTLDSPDQGVTGIEAQIAYIADDSLDIRIPSIGATYRGKLEEGEINGTFTQMGRSFPLKLKRGLPVRPRPQTPQPKYPYKTEEVSFTNENDHAVLAGTLTYPVNYHGEPVPVVLMVTGSGLQNRDEEIFGHKPFLVIADHLAHNGIATLRYDDRGFGQSTGETAEATTEDLMHDAKAGIDFLRKTGKFKSVGVLGHSEGGTIAFMLTARGKADFIVSLAGTGFKGDSVITEQNNIILGKSGQKTDMTVAKFRELASSQNVNKWYQYFIDFDPTTDIAATRCPVMAVNGTIDTQVSTNNLKSIRQLLSPNSKNLTKEYPGLNHLFQHATTGMPNEYAEIEETISPEVLADITKWINGL